MIRAAPLSRIDRLRVNAYYRDRRRQSKDAKIGCWFGKLLGVFTAELERLEIGCHVRNDQIMITDLNVSCSVDRAKPRERTCS